MVVNSARALADRYVNFAWYEARGQSDAHEELAARIGHDPEFCAHLARCLPAGEKQRPGLLLAAVRYLDGPYAEHGPRGDAAYRGWREWTLRHWDEVSAVITRRRTRTNEPARCATLLPLFARLPQPLALLEVGASAGLCLYPDRYRYRYDERPEFGPPDSAAVLPCRTGAGTPVPDRVPDIAWRAGIDLSPLDPADPDDVRWREALVWPDATDERVRRQRAAGEAVRSAPRPRMMRGDLIDALPALAAEAPLGATLVVFHTSVMACLPPERREEFARLVPSVLRERSRLGHGPGHWVSNEHHSVLPWITTPRLAHPLPTPTTERLLTLALDGRPVALTGRYGQSVQWL